jgi:hypothetical protein
MHEKAEAKSRKIRTQRKERDAKVIECNDASDERSFQAAPLASLHVPLRPSFSALFGSGYSAT